MNEAASQAGRTRGLIARRMPERFFALFVLVAVLVAAAAGAAEVESDTLQPNTGSLLSEDEAGVRSGGMSLLETEETAASTSGKSSKKKGSGSNPRPRPSKLTQEVKDVVGTHHQKWKVWEEKDSVVHLIMNTQKASAYSEAYVEYKKIE